jgi:NAD(P)-dependent dehydrogenase (short-subunit alcohol dehydrogenase family)
MYKTFRPDLANPTVAEAEEGFRSFQAMPVPWVEPADISYAVLYLASDESRYVTGLQLPVDAGATIKAAGIRA